MKGQLIPEMQSSPVLSGLSYEIFEQLKSSLSTGEGFESKSSFTFHSGENVCLGSELAVTL